VLVSRANPEFLHFFFIHEHFQRFLSDVHQRVEPWWYFLAFMLLAILPWLPQSLSTLRNALSGLKQNNKDFDAPLFLFLWIAVILLFFSISSSKLPHYIMPVMPAVALLFANTLVRDGQKGLGASSLITLLTGIIAFILVSLDNPRLMQFAAWLPWMRLGFAALILAGLAGLLMRRQSVFRRTAVISLGWYICALIILAGAQSVSQIRSAWPLLKDHVQEITPDIPVYSVGYYQQTVPFYLNRTLKLVEYKGELEFGIDQEPEKYIPTIEGFEALWQMEDKAFAVMKIETYEQLKERHLPMIERSRIREFILVEKP
jgi:4-amino-4-deoxy-L-arabinose transferase-like glycosyltransferase